MTVDTNAWLGLWPFAPFAQDTPGKLSGYLKSAGISSALVSPADAVLCREPYTCNSRLINKLRGSRILSPIVVVNPLLADWKEKLREYSLLPAVKGVKILPNYHGYSLLSGNMPLFMEEVRKSGLLLMLQVRIEDSRMQMPSMQVPPVEAAEIIKFAREYPQNRIICLCASKREADGFLRSTRNLFVDISNMEGINCIPGLLAEHQADRVLFGSHAPFFCAASAEMKMLYKDISAEDRKKICSANISLLAGGREIYLPAKKKFDAREKAG